ncbi:NYN domain-containing protein [Candidatus Saccharibacteria bacterium]|nr:NYN domain-containing protein [Candidatus Saccharibacteria bacterium]
MKIYIDGENFRKGLMNALIASKIVDRNYQLKKYQIRNLLEDVLEKKNLEIVYYASRVKLPQGYTPNKRILEIADQIKSESRVWLANVVSQKITLVKAGNLKIKQSKPCRNCHKTQEILQEKGVDVRLGADLLEDIYEKNAKTIVLFSSDTDLCPILHKAANRKVKTVYICFANSLNRAVAAAASETITIPAEKIKRYFASEEVAKKPKSPQVARKSRAGTAGPHNHGNSSKANRQVAKKKEAKS